MPMNRKPPEREPRGLTFALAGVEWILEYPRRSYTNALDRVNAFVRVDEMDTQKPTRTANRCAATVEVWIPGGKQSRQCRYAASRFRGGCWYCFQHDPIEGTQAKRHQPLSRGMISAAEQG